MTWVYKIPFFDFLFLALRISNIAKHIVKGYSVIPMYNILARAINIVLNKIRNSYRSYAAKKKVLKIKKTKNMMHM